jgi:CBS domain-containing protein
MSKIANILAGRVGIVWSVQSGDSVLLAIKLMADKGIGALCVIDDGRLSGIISERDYARKIILENRSSADTLVRDIMTANVVTTKKSDDVSGCMELMTENDFRHLPVVEDNIVLGMISIGDLVKHIIKEQKLQIDQLHQYISG